MRKTFGFDKSEKLKSRKQIEELFSRGQSFNVQPIRVIYQIVDAVTGAASVQVGVTANKKSFKKAVDRNRIKRLLRESYRLQKTPLVDQLKGGTKKLNVFFMYSGKELPSFYEIKHSMAACLEKLQTQAKE